MGNTRPVTGDGDAALVRASLSGDRAAFAAIYDRYADRLHDFCAAMLRDRDEAADATQDTFVIAAERLPQLRDADRLRPWLYAIARSQVQRRFRSRRRVEPDPDVGDVADPAAGPHRSAEQADLRGLVWAAAAGLAERDRALLDLHVRQGLDVAELGEVMGVNANHAAVMLHRLRTQVERSLGALLVARLGSDDCADLGRILAGWDGRFSPLLRKRVARHVDGCEVCDARRRAAVSPVALLSAVPLMPAPPQLRQRVLDRVDLSARAGAGERDGDGGGGGQDGGSTGGVLSGPSATVLAAAAAVVAAALLGLAVMSSLPGFTSSSGGGAGQVSPAVPSTSVADDLGSGIPEPVAAETDGAPEATAVAEEAAVIPPADAAPEVPPPALAVSATTLDLGARATSGTVLVRNAGGSPLPWTAASSAAWTAVVPAGGTLGPGEQATVTVTADRDALPEGAAEANLALQGAGQQATVRVTLTVERPPQIGPVALNPAEVGAGCPPEQATLTVPIEDESGVASATVRWSGAGSGSAALTPRGGSWFGRAGPFTTPGDAVITVEAVDTRGNAATSGPATARVLRCVE